MRIRLNAIENKIFKTLGERDEWFTTTELHNITGLSWNTLQKYLEGFNKSGWVEHKKRGNRDYWKGEPPEEAEK